MKEIRRRSRKNRFSREAMRRRKRKKEWDRGKWTRAKLERFSKGGSSKETDDHDADGSV